MIQTPYKDNHSPPQIDRQPGAYSLPHLYTSALLGCTVHPQLHSLHYTLTLGQYLVNLFMKLIDTELSVIL